MRTLLGGLGLVVLMGCTPSVVNPWSQLQRPDFVQIRVGDVPNVDDDRRVTAPWEATMGRDAFEEWSPDPQIRFEPMTPIVPPDGSRRAAWVQTFANPDHTMNHVIIHWDPELADQLTVETWRHELGHALGFTDHDTDHCDGSYRGVMSYCDFWAASHPNWFVSEDQQMLTNAHYR